MQKKLLTELIHDLEQEMTRLGYSKSYMRFHERYWKKLLQFAEKRGESFYSEQLGLDFSEQHFPYLGERVQPRTIRIFSSETPYYSDNR